MMDALGELARWGILLFLVYCAIEIIRTALR